ncbi:MAG TPA: ABC transporter permease [Gemmatimonadaceae bacterium]|jgi:predicted permease
MIKWRVVRDRLRAIRNPDRVAEEIEEELRSHVAMRAEDNVRRGMSPDEARQAATRTFGGVSYMAELALDVRGGGWIDALRQDVRFAIRQLRRSPALFIAILSLALGIGANAAIFSLFNEMLLAPLPVAHPERLVDFGGNATSPGSQSCGLGGGCDEVFSYPMFRDLEAKSGPFTGVAAHVIFDANIAFSGQTSSTRAELVSGSYFPLLGVTPALGRLFGMEDDRLIGGSPMAVLSYAYWESRLGADPNVLGRTISVNGRTLTILGVAARGFTGTTLGNRPDVYVPLTMSSALIADKDFAQFANRRRYWLYLFARLAPGISMTQAQTQANALYHSIINNVEVPVNEGLPAPVMERFKAKTLALTDGRRGQSTLHQQTTTPLILLFGITLAVLAIACVNIANLLLARATSRALEMAVRLSLGGARTRLLAQLLTESLMLAALGGLAGLGIAYATLKGIVALLPAQIASTMGFSLDWRAIAFVGLLTMVTGVLFGLLPALHSTRSDLVATLRDNSGKTSNTRSATRLRISLVTAQIALSMALLVSAGLFIRSLAKVGRVDLGMNAEHVVAFRVSPDRNGYKATQYARLFTNIEARVGALPGVSGIAGALVPILSGNNSGSDVNVQGFVKTADVNPYTRFNAVGPGYFSLLGIRLLAGREFTPRDILGSPRVAIVNESFAKKFGLGPNAVGRMMGEGDHLDVQIVGVVKDAKYSSVKQDVPPQYFFPYKQDSTLGSITFYVRSPLPLETLVPQLRVVVGALDRSLPIEEIKTLPQEVEDNVYLDRIIGMLSAAFAALATLLAAIGLYGVLAYSVAQRTKEIGVRMALGADVMTILRMILSQVAVITLVGAAIGTAAAYGIGSGAASLLYQVNGHDPLVIAASAVLVGLVALMAACLPALRAARVDPMHALRYE